MSYFLFLSCLWEDGRLTGSNLYPAAEGENLGIWTCGCFVLLPSPLLFSIGHSMVMANFLIILFLPLPNRVQGSLKLTLGRVHLDKVFVDHIQAFSPALLPVVQGALQFFDLFFFQLELLFPSYVPCTDTRRHLPSAVSSSP